MTPEDTRAAIAKLNERLTNAGRAAIAKLNERLTNADGTTDGGKLFDMICGFAVNLGGAVRFPEERRMAVVMTLLSTAGLISRSLGQSFDEFLDLAADLHDDAADDAKEVDMGIDMEWLKRIKERVGKT